MEFILRVGVLVLLSIAGFHLVSNARHLQDELIKGVRYLLGGVLILGALIAILKNLG